MLFGFPLKHYVRVYVSVQIVTKPRHKVKAKQKKSVIFITNLQSLQEKNPCIWALVNHSSWENRRSPFSPFAFLISCETCRGTSLLPHCSPISKLEVRYCLIFSEKRTAPPFGLWSAHSSLKFDWKGSVPCLSITLVLSSSERVRDEIFQPSLVRVKFVVYTLCMLSKDMWSSISSTDLNVLAHELTKKSQRSHNEVTTKSQRDHPLVGVIVQLVELCRCKTFEEAAARAKAKPRETSRRARVAGEYIYA